MKSKTFLTVAGVFLALVLLAGACSAGFVSGYLAPHKASPLSSVTNTSTSSTTTDTKDLFVPFWKAWDLVHQLYVTQPVSDTLLMQGAIKGMMDALGDKHSSYMDPFTYKDATSSQAGEYEGIGAWVNTDGTYLTISEPMPGSPAEKAGLLPGDQIIAIDGKDMTGILPEQARQRVLGPAGTTVKLSILREGSDVPFEITVTRGAIKVASVESKMLDGNIAYVKVRQFGEKTSDELKTALQDLMAKKPAGLILDLRNNPGGYLTTAVDVASQFLKSGVVLYEEYGDGTRDSYKVKNGGLATDIPMLVLVNEYSASASEVVSGAIQDQGRAKLVGVKTYGKGSVQQWIPLPNNQGAVRITVARWLTPNNRQINEIGLTPDFEVKMTAEDVKAKLDPQLDKAVEILTQSK